MGDYGEYETGNLRIIEIKTFNILHAFNNVANYGVSKDGTFLFAKNAPKSFGDGNLRIIEIKAGKVLGSFDHVGHFEESKDSAFLFAKDPSLDLFEREKKGNLRIIEIKTGKVLAAFDNVGHFEESKDGAFLFAKDPPLDPFEREKKGNLRIIAVGTGRILCELPTTIHYTHITTALKATLLSTINHMGILSVWKLESNKAILLFKTGAPELALQGANFSDVQGLGNADIALLTQRGAIHDKHIAHQQGAEVAITLDSLSKKLYQEGFSDSYIRYVLLLALR